MSNENNKMRFEMNTKNNKIKEQMTKHFEYNTKSIETLASKQSNINDLDKSSTSVANGGNIETISKLLDVLKTKIDFNKAKQEEGDEALQTKISVVQRQIDNTSELLSRDEGNQSRSTELSKHSGCSAKIQESKMSFEEKIKQINEIHFFLNQPHIHYDYNNQTFLKNMFHVHIMMYYIKMD